MLELPWSKTSPCRAVVAGGATIDQLHPEASAVDLSAFEAGVDGSDATDHPRAQILFDALD
jgi:hypothetical protein